MIRVSIAAGLLLLVVACANTVTLLIGRSVVRSREFAVRIALGSGMARLVRAALVEGLSLSRRRTARGPRGGLGRSPAVHGREPVGRPMIYDFDVLGIARVIHRSLGSSAT